MNEKEAPALSEKEEKPFFVYLLKCADDTLYCGITNDLQKRLKAHNSGTGARYTRCRLPVEMVFSKEIGSKSDALKAEAHIKSLSRSSKLEIISSPASALAQELLTVKPKAPGPKRKKA